MAAEERIGELALARMLRTVADANNPRILLLAWARMIEESEPPSTALPRLVDRVRLHRQDEITRIYLEVHNASETALRAGCSRETVYRVIKRAGLLPPHPRVGGPRPTFSLNSRETGPGGGGE